MTKHLRILFTIVSTFLTLSHDSGAQTVEINAIGSSALFLETGLAVSSIPSPRLCVWSTATDNVVIATDVSNGLPLQDSGSAWVAWTPPAGLSPTPQYCAMTSPSTQIWSYLQTDSVTGLRCLFNGCSIKNNGSGVNPDGLITSSEISLPSQIVTALNGSSGTGLVVNVAATDIRPEDAWFANTRALAPCGAPVVTGSQYLGLGYSNGDTIDSHFNTNSVHVVSFTLPTTPTIGYTVTPIGAAPILIVVNGNGSTGGFSDPLITDISSDALAKFLDGTYSYAGQARVPPSASGDPVTVIVREPLAGDFNTMEYNIPNNLTLQTSQDVGLFQPFGQINCNGTNAVNPLNKGTQSGGARQRASSTNQELAEVIFNQNSLGYAFWNLANFRRFTSGAAPFAKYLTVDGVDPLIVPSSNHNGIIPLLGSTEAANVTLGNINTVATTNYPIWSLLRFVSLGPTTPPAVNNLASTLQSFVAFGTNISHPDFITENNAQVIRSHFVPPAPTGQPEPVANGRGGLPSSSCTKAESGGDVGGVVLSLSADSTTCASQPVLNRVGSTNQRR